MRLAVRTLHAGLMPSLDWGRRLLVVWGVELCVVWGVELWDAMKCVMTQDDAVVPRDHSEVVGRSWGGRGEIAG